MFFPYPGGAREAGLWESCLPPAAGRDGPAKLSGGNGFLCTRGDPRTSQHFQPPGLSGSRAFQSGRAMQVRAEHLQQLVLSNDAKQGSASSEPQLHLSAIKPSGSNLQHRVGERDFVPPPGQGWAIAA